MSEAFQDAAAQTLKEYEALARDIVRTLPEEEWPQWVRNQMNKSMAELMGTSWKPIKITNPPVMDQSQSDLTIPDDWKISSDWATTQQFFDDATGTDKYLPHASPSVNLTPEQQSFYDEWAKDLTDQEFDNFIAYTSEAWKQARYEFIDERVSNE